MSDYYCTKCGADLGLQAGFDPHADHWFCTECGQLLSDPEVDDSDARFQNVGWFCDECGAYLNSQPGFSDWGDTWTCSECGHENRISEEDIYESEEEYQVSKNRTVESETDDGQNNDEDNDSWWGSFAVEDSSEDDEDLEEEGATKATHYKKWEVIDKEIRNKSGKEIKREIRARVWKERIENVKKFFRRLLIIVVSIVLVCAGVYGYSWFRQYRMGIAIGISSDDIIGEDYGKIMHILHENGFPNVSYEPVYDLAYKDIELENTVESVSIEDLKSFNKEDKFPRNTWVVLKYHALKKIDVPISAKDARKMNYKDLVELLQKAGFVNIRTEELSDLGLIGRALKQDEKVDSVTINGEPKFVEGSQYRPDVEVIVSYHSPK